jgi:hypothetical protein
LFPRRGQRRDHIIGAEKHAFQPDSLRETRGFELVPDDARQRPENKIVNYTRTPISQANPSEFIPL